MKILITGGNSEIAQAMVQHRANLGDHVWVTASSPDSLLKCQEHYQGLPVKTLLFNLADPSASDLSELGQQTTDLHFDAVILNACSPSKVLRLDEWPENSWEPDLKTNLSGNIWLLNRVLKTMMAKQFGRIVLISSMSAETGTGRYPIYCAIKSGLEGLIRNIAVDYGEFGITANIVRPGIVQTERTKRFWRFESFRNHVEASIPLGKMALPSQFATVLDSFLDPQSYITGSALNVSGGLPLLRADRGIKK